MKKLFLLTATITFSLIYSQDTTACDDFQIYYDIDTQRMMIISYSWSSVHNACIAYSDVYINEGTPCGEYDAGGTWMGPCPTGGGGGGGGGLCPPGKNCDDVPSPDYGG